MIASGYAATIILLLLALAGMTLEKAYFYLPAVELERRASKGDPVAKQFLRVTQYGDELRLLLVLASWLAAGIGLVLLVRLTPLVIGIVGLIAALLMLFFWQIRSPLTARGALLAAWCTPGVAAVLSWAHPLLAYPAKMFKRFRLQRSHTGLYEEADFAHFLERQKHQLDNRIRLAELERVQRVIQAGTLSVTELMIPRAQTRLMAADNQISPVLISELHQSGQAIFPVYEDKRTNIVGILKLDDIADVQQHGTVADAMNRRLAYLGERSTVTQAVRAYYETRQEVFVVVDDQRQFVGLLTLGAVLTYLFGPLDALQFGHFDDPAAVAGDKTVANKPTGVVK
jgi:CBS domain containing-hemolysin-like protein